MVQKIKPKRLLCLESCYVVLDPKIVKETFEKELDDDGNVVNCRSVITTDYAVSRNYKFSDFRIQNIIDSGAYQLLRPVSFGAPTDALFALENAASRLTDSE